jgi:hypothetical protein
MAPKGANLKEPAEEGVARFDRVPVGAVVEAPDMALGPGEPAVGLVPGVGCLDQSCCS